MKKIFFLFIILCVFIFNLVFTETLFLKDGQILKGRILSTDSNNLIFKTDSGEISFSKEEIYKIDYNDEIKKDSLKIKDQKEISREERGKQFFSFGLGGGAPYGLVGVNLEFLLGGYLGLTSGLGKSNSFGGRLYLSSKYAKFRPRITFLKGSTKNEIINGKDNFIKQNIILLGFRWKLSNRVSLDIDFGQAKDVDDTSISNTSYSNGGTTTTTMSGMAESNGTGSIGINFNF